MPEDSSPKRILYGELSECQHYVGGQNKYFEDQLKVMLKQCGIDPSELEVETADYNKSKTLCHQAIERFEISQTQNQEFRQQQYHRDDSA